VVVDHPTTVALSRVPRAQVDVSCRRGADASDDGEDDTALPVDGLRDPVAVLRELS